MTGTIKKILLSASVLASLSAIASAPASAGTLTGATITGTDIIKYDSKDGYTYNNPNADLATILSGDSSNPTGNVELFASSESNTYKSLTAFKNAPVTSLSGMIGGKSITFSSLTGLDWFTTDTGIYTTGYGASNLANKWFNEFISKAGQTANSFLYNTFLSLGGFQKSSDANISYVNQDDTTGKISFGLAGHSDLSTLYPFVPKGFQASEVVKVTYEDKTEYKYNFLATNSGLYEKGEFDKTGKKSSHTGNYELTIDGVPPTTESVPEPSAMLGLLGVGSFFAVKRKMLKKA
ncbi:NF038130 family PEP-CTERM protein [Coleofasciculus sp. FACHB-SPT36]|uniref:NF038130 family PEP-CTERM protein n=1 Tax=Cyanophyceae TaxID=3028117 RepID=UPI00168A8119|nr:NF038130 family PEP-CTERM protein [Coleofasciculus sp. FACHB-SPT36]MBD2538339.1 NF038130 family PEP-CTERM protein [Coleofasciculus sp. FACHB-SPT36]